MAELDCMVDSCVYNKRQCCCKGDIMVGGKHACNSDDTCCESFYEKKHDSYTSATEHPCKTISIDCEAVKCIYNSNYKCVADHVDIKGSGACDCMETACATFREQQNFDQSYIAEIICLTDGSEDGILYKRVNAIRTNKQSIRSHPMAIRLIGVTSSNLQNTDILKDRICYVSGQSDYPLFLIS